MQLALEGHCGLLTDLCGIHRILTSVSPHIPWLHAIVKGPVAGPITIQDLPCTALGIRQHMPVSCEVMTCATQDERTGALLGTQGRRAHVHSEPLCKAWHVHTERSAHA